MISNRFAFLALGIACVAAAAGGGYLASRQNAVPAPVVASAPDPAQPAAKAMQGTETAAVQPAAVSSAASAPSPAPTPAAAPAAPKRQEPAARARTPERVTATARPAQPSPVDRGPANPPAPSSSSASDMPAQPARQEDRAPVDTPRAQEPPQRTFEELVVSADSVMGLQMESTVSSERARVEDRVEARVVRDVRVGGQAAIPAGTRAIGSVMVVDHGGRLKERARIGIRFHTLVMADGSRLSISTDTLYRYGESPSGGSAAKIGGGAMAGAILGAILGGGKGAAIGATAGAGGGTAAVMTAERNAAIFPVGTEMTTRILSPVTVTIER